MENLFDSALANYYEQQALKESFAEQKEKKENKIEEVKKKLNQELLNDFETIDDSEVKNSLKETFDKKELEMIEKKKKKIKNKEEVKLERTAKVSREEEDKITENDFVLYF